jgi:hypothetical protein
VAEAGCGTGGVRQQRGHHRLDDRWINGGDGNTPQNQVRVLGFGTVVVGELWRASVGYRGGREGGGQSGPDGGRRSGGGTASTTGVQRPGLVGRRKNGAGGQRG